MRKHRQKKLKNPKGRGLQLSHKYTHLETEMGNPGNDFLQTSFNLTCVFTSVLKWLRAVAEPHQNANGAGRDEEI